MALGKELFETEFLGYIPLASKSGLIQRSGLHHALCGFTSCKEYTQNLSQEHASYRGRREHSSEMVRISALFPEYVPASADGFP